MRRTIALVVIALALVSCDQTYRMSASGRIPAPLDRTCVLEALRMEKSVKEAGVVEAGIYAVLNIPEPLKSPESRPEVSVDERRNDKGDLEIEFYMVWVGYTGDPEYRAWVQKTLEELRDRTIERCGGR